jgi:PadR family transcriptional regulator PadR
MAKSSDDHDLFAGALDVMILHSLRLKPMHGYALVKHIKKVSDDLLQIEQESLYLYPALRRLLKNRLLESEEGISATNRRIRTYRLKEDGIKHLEKEPLRLREDISGNQSRNRCPVRRLW